MTRRLRNADDRLRRSERELGGGGDPWEVLRQQLRAGTARSVEVTGWPMGDVHPSLLSRRAWFSPPGLLIFSAHPCAPVRVPYVFKLMDEGEVRRVGAHTTRVVTPIGMFGDVSWTGGLMGGGGMALIPHERLNYWARQQPDYRDGSVLGRASREWSITDDEMPILAQELEGLPFEKLRLFEERNREWLGGHRPNPDERMRRLERAAAAGDAEAAAQLAAMVARSGQGTSCDDCFDYAPVNENGLCAECAETRRRAEEDECQTCGGEERVRRGLCAWCRADEEGRPHGTCPACGGARDADRTCACRPPRRRNPDERMRRLERAAALGDPEAAAQLAAMQQRVAPQSMLEVFRNLRGDEWLEFRTAASPKRWLRRWAPGEWVSSPMGAFLAGLPLSAGPGQDVSSFMESRRGGMSKPARDPSGYDLFWYPDGHAFPRRGRPAQRVIELRVVRSNPPHQPPARRPTPEEVSRRLFGADGPPRQSDRVVPNRMLGWLRHAFAADPWGWVSTWGAAHTTRHLEELGAVERRQDHAGYEWIRLTPQAREEVMERLGNPGNPRGDERLRRTQRGEGGDPKVETWRRGIAVSPDGVDVAPQHHWEQGEGTWDATWDRPAPRGTGWGWSVVVRVTPHPTLTDVARAEGYILGPSGGHWHTRVAVVLQSVSMDREPDWTDPVIQQLVAGLYGEDVPQR